MSKALAAAGSLFVLAMVYGTGCNSSEGDPTSGTDRLAVDADANAFCDHTIGLLASAMETCCTAADRASPEYDLSFGLVTQIAPLCARAIQLSIAKQRVYVHTVEAEACYQAYAAQLAGDDKCRNLTTTYSEPAGPTCRRSFTGTQAAGGLCGGDHECQDGLTCIGYSGSADGMCQPPPPLGAPCGAARADAGTGSATSLEFGTHPGCESGAYCASGTCVPRVAAGGNCITSDDAHTECAEGLHCRSGKCSAEARPGAGGACRPGDCNPGYYCAVSGGAQGQCAPLKSAGGTCHGGFGFQTECAGRCDAKGGAEGTCATFCGSR